MTHTKLLMERVFFIKGNCLIVKYSLVYGLDKPKDGLGNIY